MAGIWEKEAEAMVHTKGGGVVAVVMVMVGAVPHPNNFCRSLDSGYYQLKGCY